MRYRIKAPAAKAAKGTQKWTSRKIVFNQGRVVIVVFLMPSKIDALSLGTAAVQIANLGLGKRHGLRVNARMPNRLGWSLYTFAMTAVNYSGLPQTATPLNTLVRRAG